MKVKIVLTTVIAFALAQSAFAFKIPGADKVPGANKAVPASSNGDAAGNTQAASARVKNMLAVSEATTKTYNDSLVSLNMLLGNKEEIAKLKETQEAFNKKAKTAETKTIAGPTAEAAANNIIATAENEELKEKVKSLTDQQKKSVADSAYNILLANLGFASIAADSTALVKEVSADPKNALALGGDLAALKKIASNTPGQVKSAVTVSTSVVKILKTSGIKVQEPKSTTEAAKDVNLADLGW
jgi:hypothetical protein